MSQEIQFQEGDRVRYKADGIEGEVSNPSYIEDLLLVMWDDGYETTVFPNDIEKIEE